MIRRHLFVLRNLHRRLTASKVYGVIAAENLDKTLPDVLFDAAKKHLKDDHVIRYFCKKYTMPRTDPRLLAYTYEDMFVEMVADAIEDERLDLGVDGKPVRKVMHHGVEITKTGSTIFDAMEEEWAEGLPDLNHITDGHITDGHITDGHITDNSPELESDELPDDMDLLQAIKDQMGGSNA